MPAKPPRGNQLVSVLRRAGFRGQALKTAYAIALRESGGRAQAHNPNRATGDDSYGLFQINMLGDLGPSRRGQYGLKSNDELYDALTNAKVAYRMSNGGRDFGAWGVGPNAYRKTAPLDLSSFPGGSGAGGGAAPAHRSPLAHGGGLAAALLSYAQSGGDDVGGILAALERPPRVEPSPRDPTPAGGNIEGSGPYDLSKYGGSPIAGKYRPLGTPGQGTHGYNEGPDNWQSDQAYDLGVPDQTPVYASAEGVISGGFGQQAESGRFAGRRLTVQGQSNAYYYAHLSRYAKGIKPGARVRRGQLLGYSGSGHLHYGVKNL